MIPNYPMALEGCAKIQGVLARNDFAAAEWILLHEVELPTFPLMEAFGPGQPLAPADPRRWAVQDEIDAVRTAVKSRNRSLAESRLRSLVSKIETLSRGSLAVV